MRRIREDVQRRRAAVGDRHANDAASLQQTKHSRKTRNEGVAADSRPLSRLAESGGTIERKQQYLLKDFLCFDDEDFVRNAYRGILRRELDLVGAAPFIQGLRTGRMAKPEILGRLRYSAEGRAWGIPVSGLPLAFALQLAYRAPLLGRLLSIAQFIICLPEFTRGFSRLQADVFRQRFELSRDVNAIATQIDARHARIATGLNQAIESIDGTIAGIELRQEVRDANVDSSLQRQRDDIHLINQQILALQKTSATRDDLAVMSALVDEGERRYRKLRAALVDEGERRYRELRAALVNEGETRYRELTVALDLLRHEKLDRAEGMEFAHKTEISLADVQREVSASQAQLAAIEASAEAKVRALAELDEAEAHLFDGIYVALEDRFRGTHEDIKRRVEAHLATIQAAGAGTTVAPIIDIGCGRGEWLELLRDHDLVARGVDLNPLMIARCRERGLEVTAIDAIDYLQRVDANSLGAVTGMHVIEHMPVRQLIRLIDETLRALRPGGVAIFETPNPENLIVGACTFWNDPTHHKPLPPEMMRFMFEVRSFTRVEVLRLHPYAYDLHLTAGPVQLRSRLNELLYGWQDYAIIAHKE